MLNWHPGHTWNNKANICNLIYSQHMAGVQMKSVYCQNKFHFNAALGLTVLKRILELKQPAYGLCQKTIVEGFIAK